MSLAISTIAGVGLWSVVVVLPIIEVEFGIDRGGASFPYTATMLGFAAGGVLMGRLADRFGIRVPLGIGAVSLGIGYILAAFAQTYEQYVAVQAVLIGFIGASPSFGPLVADVSHWFLRRRGVAISVVASGNYLAGTIWPPILQFAIEQSDWRSAHVGIGLFCIVSLVPLIFCLRRGQPRGAGDDEAARANARTSGSPATLQTLLVIAGLACCVAMSMPQVHIVAYCVDIGYGPARGTEMLSIMLGLGVVSRLASGMIADWIGGVRTLILGSCLQCLTLLLYLPFDGLVSLYVISALFGLSQGGIVPSYAVIVRERFPAREAGTRVSLVITATVAGMALGGWLSGEIYDLTGSYEMAFLHGIAWNLLNMGIAFWLLLGRRPRQPAEAKLPGAVASS